MSKNMMPYTRHKFLKTLCVVEQRQSDDSDCQIFVTAFDPFDALSVSDDSDLSVTKRPNRASTFLNRIPLSSSESPRSQPVCAADLFFLIEDTGHKTIAKKFCLRRV